MATFIETADGTCLFFKDWGTGDPVVLIHGWPFNADMWEYTMTALVDEGLRCVAYDRRGFGRSSQPGTGYDYDTLADDLAALLERLDLRRVTLVGFSMGGGEVARYLSRHGAGRVARAALVGSIVPGVLRTADNPDGIDESVFDFMVAALRQDRPRFFADGVPGVFGAGLPGNEVSPDLLRWAVGLGLQASPKATIDCVRAFSRADFRADLAAFTMPTLIVHGDQDASTPIDATARAAARAIPQSRLLVYEGAPHGLFLTEKDRLNRDLLAFVRG